MVTTTIGLAHLLLLALAFHSGESMKCYTCSSALNADCGDPFNNSTGLNLVQCDITKTIAESVSKQIQNVVNLGITTPEIICSKMKALDPNSNREVVTRSCMPKSDTYCAKLMETTKSVTFCELCDTDNCNGSSAVQATIMLLIMSSIALILANVS